MKEKKLFKTLFVQMLRWVLYKVFENHDLTSKTMVRDILLVLLVLSLGCEIKADAHTPDYILGRK